MSDALADVYTDAVHDELKQYAAWPIGTPIQLGDYGTIEGSIFKRIDNIRSQFKISYTPVSSPVNIVFEFKSVGVEENKVRAGGSVAVPGTSIGGNAKTELKFANGNSVYFRSIRLTLTHIDNFADVSRAIMEKFAAGEWSGSFAFVHSLFKSGGTTIIVSKADNAAIDIEAQVKGLDQFDLADANAGLMSMHDRNVGINVLASDKLVPLFSLAQVKPRFSWFPFLGERSVKTMVTDKLAIDKVAPEAGALPGHLLVNSKPQISPEMATNAGKTIDEVFQVTEIS